MDSDRSLVFEVEVTNPRWSIEKLEPYFLDRIGELHCDCTQGTPWVFIGMAALLEYLANMVIEPKDGNRKKRDLERYTEFIKGDFLPDRYKNFSYQNEYDGIEGKTKQDLPLQMYCVLRCGLVHSFSMTPDSSLWSDTQRTQNAGQANAYARKGSIVISHAASGNTHLGSYPTDVACFVAEEFAKDIEFAIRKIFETAKQNPTLRERIEQVVNAKPPLVEIEL